MLDFDGAREAIVRDLGILTTRAESLADADFDRKTRCPEWTVAALLAHVADVAEAQADGFRRLVAGEPGTPDFIERPPAGPDDVRERMRSGHDALVAALRAMEPKHQGEVVNLPFASMPCAFAIYVPLVEYGFHRDDLSDALGEPTGLDDDVAATTVGILGGFLPQIETQPADGPLAITLSAPAGSTTVVFRDGQWAVGEAGGEPHTVVSGDDRAVALFALGRIGTDDPRIAVEGDALIAAAFKRYFPGP